MPSRDQVNTKANEWMEREGTRPRSDLARPNETGRAGTPAPSAALMRLAHRLGVSAESLAEKYPADTVRRTHYPVTEVVKDGRVTYRDILVLGDEGRHRVTT